MIMGHGNSGTLGREKGTQRGRPAGSHQIHKPQEDPELRLLAIRVVGYLIRTELSIRHKQDQAAVDPLK
jgi:hypothetical protein